MKYIFTNLFSDLVEVGQENPLKFVVMSQKNDNTFVNDTDVFKCKDYFNDFTIYRNLKHSFSVYGMASSQAKFDAKGGLHVLLMNVSPHFMDNASRLVEGELRDLWGIRLDFIPVDRRDIEHNYRHISFDTDCVHVYFSPECFVSTFRISLITVLLRCCNADRKIDSWEKLINCRVFVRDAHLQYIEHFNRIRNKELCFAQQASCVWLKSANFGGGKKDTPKTSNSILHNNGLSNWFSLLYPGTIGTYMSTTFRGNLPINYFHYTLKEEDELFEEEDEEEEA